MSDLISKCVLYCCVHICLRCLAAYFTSKVQLTLKHNHNVTRSVHVNNIFNWLQLYKRLSYGLAKQCMMPLDIGTNKDRKETINGIALKKQIAYKTRKKSRSISLTSRDNEYSMNARGSTCKVYLFLIVG